MKRLLNWYWANWQFWKQFRKFPESFKALGKWPSETYMKYPPTCHFNGKKVLNFGCGTSVYKFPNVVNLDCVPGNGVNIVTTEKRLPFSDNTFDHIIANHVMEHVPNWFETMKEFARTVKVGGKIEVWIPPISSDSTFAYRDHINRIGWESFFGCKTMHRNGANILAGEELKTMGDFAKLELVGKFYKTKIVWWILIMPESVVRWMAEYLRNVVSEEGYIFIKGE